METEVKQDINERSRLASVIIEVKTDDGIEMVNPTSSKQHFKQNENCQSSEGFQGTDHGVGAAGMIVNGDAESGSGMSWKGSDEIKMCRICHLGKLESSNTEMLIQLGCGCKSELGASHLSCAQTWFKLKGNRMCEICGKIAQNVSGVEETYTNANLILVVEWDEMGRFRNTTGVTATTRATTIIQDRERCHRNCRNVVLASLVLAFIIPWLFRVNLF